jgi:DNA repair protein RadC
MGSLNASIVHPREVFRAAIKRSSASIICVHNHPSGDPTPSPEDIQMTARLVEAGQIIGIEVLDHIILGDQNFISLKEKGFM